MDHYDSKYDNKRGLSQHLGYVSRRTIGQYMKRVALAVLVLYLLTTAFVWLQSDPAETTINSGDLAYGDSVDFDAVPQIKLPTKHRNDMPPADGIKGSAADLANGRADTAANNDANKPPRKQHEPVVPAQPDVVAGTKTTTDKLTPLVPKKKVEVESPPATDTAKTKPPVPVTPPTEKVSAPASLKRQGHADAEGMAFIRGMMEHAWGQYVKHAWGHDEVKPVSGSSKDWLGARGLAATIVDSLDTLYIMGMFSEFERSKKFVLTELDFNLVGVFVFIIVCILYHYLDFYLQLSVCTNDNLLSCLSIVNFMQPVRVSLFETVIRVVGGLLSAYDLCGDYRLVLKAADMADRLLPGFNTRTGIPNNFVDLTNGQSHGNTWSGGAILSEYGSIQLEFKYLSDLTGDPKYEQKAKAAVDYILAKAKPHPGLFPTVIDNDSGEWGGGEYTVGALADSFYEYLLKCWLISDKSDKHYRDLYDESAKAIQKHLIGVTAAGDMYLGAGHVGQPIPAQMEHLTCFAGGMFALGAVTDTNDPQWRAMLQVGANLTETCYKMYHKQPLGIGAEKTAIDSFEAMPRYYILRPEVIESIFYMWRLTHDQKYRRWGMEIARSIEKWCRADGGYSGIDDVTASPPQLNDTQESFFLAETLKYLYLLFTDDDVISLDRYVFNTEAHPLSTVKNRRPREK